MASRRCCVGRVGAQHRAPDTGVFVLAGGSVGASAGAEFDLSASEVAEEFVPLGAGGLSVLLAQRVVAEGEGVLCGGLVGQDRDRVVAAAGHTERAGAVAVAHLVSEAGLTGRHWYWNLTTAAAPSPLNISRTTRRSMSSPRSSDTPHWTVMVYAKLYPTTLVESYRQAMRGIYADVHGAEALRTPTVEEWAAFSANCSMRDMGTHLCALPTCEHCPKGLVCLGCNHANPRRARRRRFAACSPATPACNPGTRNRRARRTDRRPPDGDRPHPQRPPACRGTVHRRRRCYRGIRHLTGAGSDNSLAFVRDNGTTRRQSRPIAPCAAL